MEVVKKNFGTAAEFEVPKGGIFLWISLPENVDTIKLGQLAALEGIALNPGSEWSTDPKSASSKLRLCFGHPSQEIIKEGVSKLADICHREFGVPVRGANKVRN